MTISQVYGLELLIGSFEGDLLTIRLEKDAAETWPDMRASIDQQLASLDYTVKHVR